MIPFYRLQAWYRRRDRAKKRRLHYAAIFLAFSITAVIAGTLFDSRASKVIGIISGVIAAVGSFWQVMGEEGSSASNSIPTRRSFQLSTIPSLPHDHVSPSSTSGIRHATELVFASPYWPSPSQHQARQAQSTSQSSSIHIHPLLSYFPYQSSLQYDVTMPPDIPTSYQLELQSPATEPPVFYMALFSKLLPWLIEISTSSSERYINISDVLDTIYHELQRPITLAEYDALGSVVKERINWAFISRCANIGDPSEQDKERNKGVKRVDFLRDRNRFTGLSTSAVNSDYWEVHLR